eukprot:scaffold5297_cov374-Prasinococcus_capsulatus_cf.AAC.7
MPVPSLENTARTDTGSVAEMSEPKIRESRMPNSSQIPIWPARYINVPMMTVLTSVPRKANTHMPPMFLKK